MVLFGEFNRSGRPQANSLSELKAQIQGTDENSPRPGVQPTVVSKPTLTPRRAAEVHKTTPRRFSSLPPSFRSRDNNRGRSTNTNTEGTRQDAFFSSKPSRPSLPPQKNPSSWASCRPVSIPSRSASNHASRSTPGDTIVGNTGTKLNSGITPTIPKTQTPFQLIDAIAEPDSLFAELDAILGYSDKVPIPHHPTNLHPTNTSNTSTPTVPKRICFAPSLSSLSYATTTATSPRHRTTTMISDPVFSTSLKAQSDDLFIRSKTSSGLSVSTNLMPVQRVSKSEKSLFHEVASPLKILPIVGQEEDSTEKIVQNCIDRLIPNHLLGLMRAVKQDAESESHRRHPFDPGARADTVHIDPSNMFEVSSSELVNSLINDVIHRQEVDRALQGFATGPSSSFEASRDHQRLGTENDSRPFSGWIV